MSDPLLAGVPATPDPLLVPAFNAATDEGYGLIADQIASFTEGRLEVWSRRKSPWSSDGGGPATNSSSGLLTIGAGFLAIVAAWVAAHISETNRQEGS